MSGYEEGRWTPILISTEGVMKYSQAGGAYEKIGAPVQCGVRIVIADARARADK